MTKIIAFTLLVAAALFACFSPAAIAQSAVNWNQGYITAIGQGTAEPSGNRGKDRLMAERAAQVVAYRELLEITKGVHVDSNTTVENMMVKEDIVKARVEGIVKGAQIINKKTEWEGNIPSSSVEVRLCINNANCQGASLIGSLGLDKVPDPAPKNVYQLDPGAPPAPKAPSISYDTTKKVTGVIFNLEGRPFEKSLLPVVVTVKESNPQTVYSVKTVKPNIIRTYGVVRYADTVDNGKQMTYLGDNILVISVSDVNKENFIVIDKDAARLLKETTLHDNDYPSEAKVVIAAR